MSNKKKNNNNNSPTTRDERIGTTTCSGWRGEGGKQGKDVLGALTPAFCCLIVWLSLCHWHHKCYRLCNTMMACVFFRFFFPCQLQTVMKMFHLSHSQQSKTQNSELTLWFKLTHSSWQQIGERCQVQCSVPLHSTPWWQQQQQQQEGLHFVQCPGECGKKDRQMGRRGIYQFSKILMEWQRMKQEESGSCVQRVQPSREDCDTGKDQMQTKCIGRHWTWGKSWKGTTTMIVMWRNAQGPNNLRNFEWWDKPPQIGRTLRNPILQLDEMLKQVSDKDVAGRTMWASCHSHEMMGVVRCWDTDETCNEFHANWPLSCVSLHCQISRILPWFWLLLLSDCKHLWMTLLDLIGLPRRGACHRSWKCHAWQFNDKMSLAWQWRQFLGMFPWECTDRKVGSANWFWWCLQKLPHQWSKQMCLPGNAFDEIVNLFLWNIFSWLEPSSHWKNHSSVQCVEESFSETLAAFSRSIDFQCAIRRFLVIVRRLPWWSLWQSNSFNSTSSPNLGFLPPFALCAIFFLDGTCCLRMPFCNTKCCTIDWGNPSIKAVQCTNSSEWVLSTMHIISARVYACSEALFWEGQLHQNVTRHLFTASWAILQDSMPIQWKSLEICQEKKEVWGSIIATWKPSHTWNDSKSTMDHSMLKHLLSHLCGSCMFHSNIQHGLDAHEMCGHSVKLWALHWCAMIWLLLRRKKWEAWQKVGLLPSNECSVCVFAL